MRETPKEEGKGQPARPPRDWWYDTPWKQIEAEVKATLSRKEYEIWRWRPNVQGRSRRLP